MPLTLTAPLPYHVHCQVYKQWVGITDPVNKKDKGLQGCVVPRGCAHPLATSPPLTHNRLVVPPPVGTIHSYLKVSVTVLGPGDAPKVHDPVKDDEEAAAAAGGADGAGSGPLDTLVLMPPNVSRSIHFLVVTIRRVEDLPALDGGFKKVSTLTRVCSGLWRFGLAGWCAGVCER